MTQSDSAAFEPGMSRLWIRSRSRFPPGDSPTPARASASSCRPAAASTLEEKFSDAAEVHRLTGATPTMALHVLWDLPNGVEDVPEVQALEQRYRRPLRLHQSQSLSGSGVQVRLALQSLVRDSRAGRGAHVWTPSRSPSGWARATSRSGWPTARTIRARRAFASASAGLKKRCAQSHSHLAPDQRLLVEYKPFEPAFYHTDIADWGMSSHLAARGRPAGARAGRYRPSLLSRRTSSRSWPGCCTPACSADSTSTTAATPTTT